MRPKRDLVAPIWVDEGLLEEEPPDDERRRHEATHVPHASWCPICVESRGIDARHSSTVQLEGTELQVLADYMFFTGDMDLDKPGCNLWRPEAEKRSMSTADNAASKRGRAQEALDRERLAKRPQEDVSDIAYSLEIAGAITSDAMIMDESTDQINVPTLEEKRARVAALADVDEDLFGTVTNEMRQAVRLKELEDLEEFGVFESIAIEDCVDDKVLGTTWVERLKNGQCRSRLCVQDFATTKSDEYFCPYAC